MSNSRMNILKTSKFDVTTQEEYYIRCI